ncbi:MAG: hypothetical protein AAF962_01185 [Actinomycetota bacterium]
MRTRLVLMLLALGVPLLAACGTSDPAGEVTAAPADGDADGDGDEQEGGEGESADEGEDGGGETDAGGDEDGDDGGDDAPGGEDDEDEDEGGGESGGEVEIPGDPFDIGPQEGDRLDVVGVAFDDELNFRVLPDPGSTIVDSVAPEAASPVVLSLGEGRLLTNSAWWHVTVDGEEAWANFTFLGMLGSTSSIGLDLFDRLPSTEFATVEEMAEAVADLRAGGPVPTVTFVTEPTLLTGEQSVVVDVIGIGDDAVKGERITLFYTDIPGRSGVDLFGADATAICSRGRSGEFCL